MNGLIFPASCGLFVSVPKIGLDLVLVKEGSGGVEDDVGGGGGGSETG